MSIIPSAAPNDANPAGLSPQREAEIRTELATIPAPPWRWIGSRHAGGPELVTDHSGRQYLLRAAKPTDHRGDELLDPEIGYAIYGDLEFRNQREGEKYSTMRPGNALATGRTEYDPDAIVGVANPVARWIEASALIATELLAEVDRLRADLADQTRATEYFANQSRRRGNQLATDPSRRQVAPVEAFAYDMEMALVDLPPAERRGADAVLQVLRARAEAAVIPFTTEDAS